MGARSSSSSKISLENASGTIESDDVFCMRFDGQPDGPVMAKLLDFTAAWAGTKRRIYIVGDLTKLQGFTYSARKELQAKRIQAGGMIVICFGTSFHVRIIAEMVWRAATSLGHVPPEVELYFVKGEKEARELLQKKRDGK